TEELDYYEAKRNEAVQRGFNHNGKVPAMLQPGVLSKALHKKLAILERFLANNPTAPPAEPAAPPEISTGDHPRMAAFLNRYYETQAFKDLEKVLRETGLALDSDAALATAEAAWTAIVGESIEMDHPDFSEIDVVEFTALIKSGDI